MEPYAVIKTGGKQYMVKAGETLQVEKLSGDKGARIELSPVLAVSDGKELKSGRPILEGAKVTATVVDHILGPKLVAFKKKRRKGYSRKIGHRQDLTVLKIEAIQ